MLKPEVGKPQDKNTRPIAVLFVLLCFFVEAKNDLYRESFVEIPGKVLHSF